MPKRPGGMYCSQACAYRARDAQPDPSRKCAICSEPLRKGQKPSELCCSRTCGDQLQMRNNAREREARTGYAEPVKVQYSNCLLCAEVVVRKAARGTWRPYCSAHDEQVVAAHRRAGLAAQSRAWRASQPRKERPPRPEVERTCAECDEQFATVHTRAKYCAEKCRARARRRMDKISEGRRAVSTGTRRAVYARDNGQCHLCRHAVRLDGGDGHENTWAATLDHIVPHSQGGSDELGNLATAHRWCNSLRGDLPAEAARASLADMPPLVHWDGAEWNRRRALIESYVAPLEVAA